MERYEQVNRFQDIISHRRKYNFLPRQCGKTTLLCHEIAAEIELSKPQHIFVQLRLRDHKTGFLDILRRELFKHNIYVDTQKRDEIFVSFEEDGVTYLSTVHFYSNLDDIMMKSTGLHNVAYFSDL